MNRTVTILVFAVIMTFFAIDHSSGHGGQYRGPGGTDSGSAPPPPDQSGSGSSSASGGPTVPAPTTATPGGSGGGGRRGRSGGGGMQRKRYSASFGLERWEFWWEYNKDSYLNLKNQLFSNDRYLGTGSFLIGQSRKGLFRTSQRVTPEMARSELLPALLSVLSVDHPDVQDSAVLAMARITPSTEAATVIDAITGVLSSKYDSVRQSACLSLGVLGAPEGIPICRDLMFDTAAGRKLVGRSEVPRLVRAFAALSLGLIGSEESIPDLFAVVEKENQMTRKDLISCAITALGLLDTKEKRGTIVRFLVERLAKAEIDPYIRSFIPIALGRLGDSSAIETILTAFKEKDQHDCVRQSCAIALGVLATVDDKEVVELLESYIREGRDVQTRHFTFIALAQIGARDQEYCANADAHKDLQRFFVSEIERPSRMDHLSWSCLAASIHAMAHQPLQGGVIKRICNRFDDVKNPSDKGAMAISLGLLNAQGSAQRLFDELKETRDKTLQGYLCVSLGLMNWTAAAETIRDFVSTETVFFLQLQASVALGLMGDRDAVGLLVASLEKGGSLNIISSAARALGQIGDQRAVAPLKNILENPKAHNLSKAFAVVALGLVGERTVLPWNTRISENVNYRASLTAISEALDIL